MVRCDVFELRASVGTGPTRVLQWDLVTDLPPGSRCTLAIERGYDNTEGRLELWTLYEQHITVATRPGYNMNGARGEIDIDQGDLAALAALLADAEQAVSGIRDRPSERIEVSCILGAPQPLRDFGPNNLQLTGSQVTEHRDLRVVDVSTFVYAPVANDLFPEPVEPSRPVA
jgi:hypothetical protein